MSVFERQFHKESPAREIDCDISLMFAKIIVIQSTCSSLSGQLCGEQNLQPKRQYGKYRSGRVVELAYTPMASTSLSLTISVTVRLLSYRTRLGVQCTLHYSQLKVGTGLHCLVTTGITPDFAGIHRVVVLRRRLFIHPYHLY
jgi:hypothetical protein